MSAGMNNGSLNPWRTSARRPEENPATAWDVFQEVRHVRVLLKAALKRLASVGVTVEDLTEEVDYERRNKVDPR